MSEKIFGNMIQEHFVARVRKADKGRKECIAALRTRADAQHYVKSVRKKIKAVFSLPLERTPLNIKSVGVIEASNGIKIEKLIYESRPGYPVTANLYLPTGSEKHPAVLFLCGHSDKGKADDIYQTACQSLALQGYVVLILDPVSQGERCQYSGIVNAQGIDHYCTAEHNLIGKQMGLLGEFFGVWRVWDAMRGLDCLLARPEVDPAHVGVTGNSGGGTISTWMSALDERLTMVAPSCYVTNWRRNFENELPVDAEQVPPGILAAACDMGDFFLAHAPRPVLLLGQSNDIFDSRGTQETYEEIAKVYKLLGAADKCRIHIGPDSHGYYLSNRETMYRFFNEQCGINGFDGEPAGVDLQIEKDLNCTPTGNTVELPETFRLHDIISKKANEFAVARKCHSPTALACLLKEKLSIKNPIVPYSRSYRQELHSAMPGRIFSRYGLETEEDIIVTLKRPVIDDILFHIPKSKQVTLYIPNLDSANELSLMKYEEKPGVPTYGLDYRGIGESMAAGFRQWHFFHIYGSDYHFTVAEEMLGDSWLGKRVYDVLCTVEFLKESAGVRKINLIGRGQGTVIAAVAALFIDEINSITLHNAPESWTAMLQSPICWWPVATMPRGILQFTDLPEIYTALKDKNLNIVSYADLQIIP